MEERTLLDGSITPNPTNWLPVGPDNAADPAIAGNANDSGRVNAIAVSPNFDGFGSAAMFIGTAHGGVWRSTNFAGPSPTWVPLTDNVGETVGLKPEQEVGLSGIGAVAVDPNHGNIIYAGTGDDPFHETGAGVLKSTDGGNTWALLGQSTFAGNTAINKIVVDPTDVSGNTVYASSSGAGIFKSQDGGQTWQLKMNGLPGDATVVTPTDLEYTLTRPDPLSSPIFTLYAGIINGPDAGNGIWRLNPSIDDTWHQQDMNLIDFLGRAVGRAAIGTIKLSADHSVTTSARIDATIAYSIPVDDPADNLKQLFLTLNVFHFDPSLNTWSPAHNLPPGNTQNGYSESIGLAPDGTIYVGAVGDVKSTDGGNSWTNIHEIPLGHQLTHVDSHAWAFFGGQVYGGNDGGIWRFDPAANQWHSLNTAGLSTMLLRGASMSPTDPNVLIAAAQDNGDWLRQSGSWRRFHGRDGGRVFFDPDPGQGGRIAYKIDTFGGLFRSDNGGASYPLDISRNIPGQPGSAS
jgi:photosystem II stability/assembly factor-like uncharacterized protein